MKCYTQVYVMNSIEAVETYCRAFGAEVTFEIKNCATVMDRYGVCRRIAI